MDFITKSERGSYSEIPDDESSLSPPRPRSRQRRWIFNSILSTICLATGFALCLLIYQPFQRHTPDQKHTTCTSPATRLEWRSLSRDQKQNYLQAVQCLKTKPSRIFGNQTLYDDFPYIHIQIGDYCKVSGARTILRY